MGEIGNSAKNPPNGTPFELFVQNDHCFCSHGNYLNVLYDIKLWLNRPLQTLAHAVNAEVLKDPLIPTVIHLANDPIPNIRFNVAKALEQIIPLAKKAGLSSLITEQVKPSLLKLNEDADQDVRFFAQRAIAQI